MSPRPGAVYENISPSQFRGLPLQLSKRLISFLAYVSDTIILYDELTREQVMKNQPKNEVVCILFI